MTARGAAASQAVLTADIAAWVMCTLATTNATCRGLGGCHWPSGSVGDGEGGVGPLGVCAPTTMSLPSCVTDHRNVTDCQPYWCVATPETGGRPASTPLTTGECGILAPPERTSGAALAAQPGHRQLPALCAAWLLLLARKGGGAVTE